MVDGTLEGFIARALKVPARPDPPFGSRRSLQVFNAAPGFYRYRLARWAVSQLGTLFGLVAGFYFLGQIEMNIISFIRGFFIPIEIIGIGFFILQLPVTLLMVRLDYRYRWYMATDTSLRIREGLLTVDERTMTYANIQNIAIRQGPLQRLLGIADLRVRTAGGGGSEGTGSSESDGTGASNMHLGYFRGVDNAAEIRDLIMARMRILRDSGLGDPDEAVGARQARSGGDARSTAVLVAARALREEARSLRLILEDSAPGN